MLGLSLRLTRLKEEKGTEYLDQDVVFRLKKSPERKKNPYSSLSFWINVHFDPTPRPSDLAISTISQVDQSKAVTLVPIVMIFSSRTAMHPLSGLVGKKMSSDSGRSLNSLQTPAALS